MAGTQPAAAGPAVLDSGFNNAFPTGLNSYVSSVTWDGSGYVIGGLFSNGPGGTSKIFRVNQNGSPDATFNGNTPAGLDNEVFSATWDGSGYVIGGTFTNGPGGTSKIFRVNQNGQSDSSFNAAIHKGLGSSVSSVAWDGSGYVIGGGLTNGPGGTSRVFRVNRNGTPDTTFNGSVVKNLDHAVRSVTWDGSGYLIGGLFSNGPGGTSHVFRVHRNGTPDATFNGNIPAGLNGPVSSVAWDGSGYLIGGWFTNGPGGTSRIFRVHRNGTPDTVFNGNAVKGLNDEVESVAWDGSGFLIGGYFSNGPGGTRQVFRIHRNGTPDAVFNGNIVKNLNAEVYSVAWDGGGYVIGGVFTNGPGTSAGSKRVFRMANVVKPNKKPGSLKVKGGPTARTYKVTWKQPAGTSAIRPVANYHLTVKAKGKSLVSKKLRASKPKHSLARGVLLKQIKRKKVRSAAVHRLTAEVRAANPLGKGPVARKAFRMSE